MPLTPNDQTEQVATPAPVEVARITPPEQPSAIETTPTQPEVYVEGEPLPPDALPPVTETIQEPIAATPREETVAPAPVPEDPAQKAIEKKLESGVEEAFGALDPLAQHAFLARGQETALMVRNLLAAPKLDAKGMKGLADTIHNWLALLPGVSPAWLEQQTWATVGNLMEIRGS